MKEQRFTDPKKEKPEKVVPPGAPVPDITLPGRRPPVPNRAWTEMRLGADIDELTDEEKMTLFPPEYLN